MSDELEEVVKLATGTMVQIEVWQQVLLDAGVKSHTVGNDLTAGIGTALVGGTVELWVKKADLAQAEAALKYAEAHRGHSPVEHGPHGPVGSDPKPKDGPTPPRNFQNPTY